MNKNKNKNRGWARKRGWRKEGKKEKASSKQANSDEMERREERKKRKRSRERERRCGRAVVDAMRNEEEEKEGEVALCVRVQEDGQKVKIRSGEGGTESVHFLCAFVSWKKIGRRGKALFASPPRRAAISSLRDTDHVVAGWVLLPNNPPLDVATD